MTNGMASSYSIGDYLIHSLHEYRTFVSESTLSAIAILAKYSEGF